MAQPHKDHIGVKAEAFVRDTAHAYPFISFSKKMQWPARWFPAKQDRNMDVVHQEGLDERKHLLDDSDEDSGPNSIVEPPQNSLSHFLSACGSTLRSAWSVFTSLSFVRIRYFFKEVEDAWNSWMLNKGDYPFRKRILNQPQMTRHEAEQLGLNLASMHFGQTAGSDDAIQITPAIRREIRLGIAENPFVFISKALAVLFFLLDLGLILAQKLLNTVIDTPERIFRFGIMKKKTRTAESAPLGFGEMMVYGPFALVIWLIGTTLHLPSAVFHEARDRKISWYAPLAIPGFIINSALWLLNWLIFPLTFVGSLILDYDIKAFSLTFFTLMTATFRQPNMSDLIVSWRPEDARAEGGLSGSRPFKNGRITKWLKEYLGSPLLLSRLLLVAVYWPFDFTNKNVDLKVRLWRGLIGFALIMLPLMLGAHLASGLVLWMSMLSFAVGGMLLVEALIANSVSLASDKNTARILNGAATLILIGMTLMMLPSILGLPYFTLNLGLAFLVSALISLVIGVILAVPAWKEASQDREEILEQEKDKAYMKKMIHFTLAHEKEGYQLAAKIQVGPQEYTVIQSQKNQRHQVIPTNNMSGLNYLSANIQKKTYSVESVALTLKDQLTEHTYWITCTYHLNFMATLAVGRSAIKLRYIENEKGVYEVFGTGEGGNEEIAQAEALEKLRKIDPPNLDAGTQDNFKFLNAEEVTSIKTAVPKAQKKFAKVTDPLSFSSQSDHHHIFRQEGNYWYKTDIGGSVAHATLGADGVSAIHQGEHVKTQVVSLTPSLRQREAQKKEREQKEAQTQFPYLKAFQKMSRADVTSLYGDVTIDDSRNPDTNAIWKISELYDALSGLDINPENEQVKKIQPVCTQMLKQLGFAPEVSIKDYPRKLKIGIADAQRWFLGKVSYGGQFFSPREKSSFLKAVDVMERAVKFEFVQVLYDKTEQYLKSIQKGSDNMYGRLSHVNKKLARLQEVDHNDPDAAIEQITFLLKGEILHGVFSGIQQYIEEYRFDKAISGIMRWNVGLVGYRTEKLTERLAGVFYKQIQMHHTSQKPPFLVEAKKLIDAGSFESAIEKMTSIVIQKHDEDLLNKTVKKVAPIQEKIERLEFHEANQLITACEENIKSNPMISTPISPVSFKFGRADVNEGKQEDRRVGRSEGQDKEEDGMQTPQKKTDDAPGKWS